MDLITPSAAKRYSLWKGSCKYSSDTRTFPSLIRFRSGGKLLHSDSSPSISQPSGAAVANYSCQNIIYQLLKDA